MTLRYMIATAALALSTPVIAQDEAPTTMEAAEQTALETRAEQVIGVVNGDIPPGEVFTDGFLAVVPVAQFEAISQQLTSQFGAAVSVESVDPPEGTRAALAIRMERAIARGGLAIDLTDDNRISELLFQSFETLDDSPEKIEAELAALPGKTSWWFGPIDGGEPVMASDDDPQMALGSTFKLYVLAALAREVAEGKRSWNDTVTLSGSRSFPSGMMQDWPEDAPVTLHTLASLMISISDNTATDELIRVLGRDAVHAAVVDSGHSSPVLNDPFLTTRDMFLLKAGPQARLSAYRSGSASERLQILDAIDEPALPTSRVQAAFSGGPVALDVEWFASASDLASLFRFMRKTGDEGAFGIMAINPSIPKQTLSRWTYAGYKGGSEPGVLNLTWLLTDAEGRDHALVLSWTNEEANLDQTALDLIAQRIIALPQ